ncbi:MAG TPA: hypothetical protein VFR95_10425, partial [Gemmatimonadaceae bacterium]|nr:hypothetical protein [Gemmatimonadaceae bacterium]
MKRRALPLDQMVRWLPLDDAYYLLAEVMTSARALPLVVMQEALLQVEMHASSEVYGSTCGVLWGGHYRDPGSGAAYILVEGIERATRVYRDADPEASLAVDLSHAIDAAERAGHMVIGWYRFDVALFPRIPVADAGIHRALFSEPWQVALLRDGADGEGSGVFMRVEPTEGRAFPIPFFELIPKKRARGRDSKRTSVQWRNYNAESEVVPLPVDAYRSPAPPHAKRAKTNGAHVTPPRAGIFSRLSMRLSAPKQERPLFPHKPAERAAASEVPPPSVEPRPHRAESWTPLEAAEPPHAASLDGRRPEAPEMVKGLEIVRDPEPVMGSEMVKDPERVIDPATLNAHETAQTPDTAQMPDTAQAPETVGALEAEQEPEAAQWAEAARELEAEKEPEAEQEPEPVHEPRTAHAPEIVEPPATTEIPEELPSTQEEPGWARAATDAAYQSPTEELDALFTEWRPDAAGRATSRAFGAPRGRSVAGSLVKRAIAAAIVLAAVYFGVQRVRAERASGQPVAAVATDTASAASNEQERTEDVATGRLAEAAEARPSNGGFSAAERAEVRSSLARIGESRVVLVAHLDTLSSMLSGSASDTSASDSTAAERCTRAD